MRRRDRVQVCVDHMLVLRLVDVAPGPAGRVGVGAEVVAELADGLVEGAEGDLVETLLDVAGPCVVEEVGPRRRRPPRKPVGRRAEPHVVEVLGNEPEERIDHIVAEGLEEEVDHPDVEDRGRRALHALVAVPALQQPDGLAAVGGCVGAELRLEREQPLEIERRDNGAIVGLQRPVEVGGDAACQLPLFDDLGDPMGP